MNSLVNQIKNLFSHSAVQAFDPYQLPNFEESQWWNLERLKAYQLGRLQFIINYSYENIPGYREKYDKANISPSEIKTLADLARLPILEREELQENPKFVNQELIYENMYTGGSTGAPLHYYEDEMTTTIRWNMHKFGWKLYRYSSGSRLAIISSAQGIVDQPNTLNLSGDLTESNLKSNTDALVKFKPEFIRAYVSSAYLLAKYMYDQKIAIQGVKAVNVISENLYPYQRELIEKVFSCKVFEEYVCNDGGAAAWECEKHMGLHYMMQRTLIEEVNGDMIVTDLWNRAMPFIRYKNGDRVEFSDKKCSCGRELPLISVRGRQNDVLISKEGLISPSFLLHHALGIKSIDSTNSVYRSGITAIQYVQKPGYIVEVNIVKNKHFDKQQLNALTGKLEKILKGMQLHIKYVEQIPSTPKGKRSFVINLDEELLKEKGVI